MTPNQTAETIKQIADLKSLEIYRDEKMDLVDAQEMDLHLTDLSTRIIEALGLMPGDGETVDVILHVPAETFEQLAETAVEQLAVEEAETEPVIEPDQEENNRESQTTEQEPDPEPAPGGATAEEASSEPISGGELDTKQTKRVADLLDWMAREELSQTKAGKAAGVSGVTICHLLAGKTQGSDETWKKIQRAIRKSTKAKKKPKPVTQTTKPNGKGPAQFVQTKLSTWLGANQLGHKDAAARMGITEGHIRSICNGILPSCAILKQISHHIPEIKANLGFLLSQARPNENGQGAST